MTRPVTVTDVEADLHANADFRGIPDANRRDYLFGMCMAKLAQANTEIVRLEKLSAAQQSELEDLHG